MTSLIKGFSFSKNESTLARIGRQGVTMFLEHRTSVKMDHSMLNIRVNIKVMGLLLGNWSMV